MAVSQKRPSVASVFFGGREPEDTEYIFQDEQCIVFDEQRNKQAPVHFIVVPKKMTPTLSATTVDHEKALGHLLLVAKQIAVEKGLDKSGYHVMVDEQHQTKSLKSLHVFGRALHHMVWPTGPGSRL
ncbi:adenosine 5'-monophosphoramidase HINT2-like [Helicoverpa zea]|uniref:adenosine 5'-monophosphoramidase HINT2-like n=1 Tax=Helicoverpa zea TaxID=7113 RepID=UPI001F58999F|nr:adenosine 5'-monophosphoramidase HINT2-like [Helicoverpa zea]